MYIRNGFITYGVEELVRQNLAEFPYNSSRTRAKSKLFKPARVNAATVFRPIKTKLAPSHRLTRAAHNKNLTHRRQLITGTRWELPVTDIEMLYTVNPLAFYTVENNIGFKFDNSYGKVFLEVFSSTISQNFTIQTGHVIAEEWPLTDEIYNVSNADTIYRIGPFPRDRYNQRPTPDPDYVYVDHAVTSILKFRAWRIP